MRDAFLQRIVKTFGAKKLALVLRNFQVRMSRVQIRLLATFSPKYRMRIEKLDQTLEANNFLWNDGTEKPQTFLESCGIEDFKTVRGFSVPSSSRKLSAMSLTYV